MNRKQGLVCASAFGLMVIGASVLATTNVDPVNKWSWGENIGFMNWADANTGVDGVEVFSDHLKGFIWCENVGWVNTGNGGGPYANTNGTNFGVNILGSGFCDGFAWGENIGWINFGTQPTITTDGARFDTVAGRFRGFAWGENVGWINLDDGTKFVAAIPTAPCLGDANGDGIVNFDDITAIVANWLNTGAPGIPGDANFDGIVNFDDITAVVANWLNTCP